MPHILLDRDNIITIKLQGILPPLWVDGATFRSGMKGLLDADT